MASDEIVLPNDREKKMRNLLFALSASLVVSVMGATAASAHSMCDGDFQFVDGRWVATRACQLNEAEKVSEERHMHISQHPSGPNEWSTEEFCRGNPDIRVSTLCAAYN
jgi:hypothetical protein